MLNRNFYSSYIHFRDKYVQNPATCLPHIVTENCLKSLKTTRNQALKSGCLSVNFAQYSKLAEDFRLVQFPYGAPDHMLGNSVNTLFPSFSFIVKIRFVLYRFFILKMRSFEPGFKHPSALFLA